MSDIATKLTYLNETKSQLKDMINYGLPTENQITNETTFRNYVKGIFEAFIESLRDSTTLYTNLPKISGNGTQITLNDTANAPMRINLNPTAISQSPNLFNGNLTSGYIGFDGTIVSSNDWKTSNDYIEIEPNKTYVVSGTNMGARVLYGFYNSSKTFIPSRKETTPNTQFTSVSNAKYIKFSTNSTTPTNIELKGIPTPDSPQDIHTISGDNTIVVESGDGLSGIQLISGYIKSDDTVVTSTSWYHSDYIDTTNFDYYITTGYIGDTPKTILYDSNKTPIQVINLNSNTKKTYSLSGASYIRISTTSSTLSSQHLIKQQTTPINLDTIEYCKIGNYEDEFILTSGKNLLNPNVATSNCSVDTTTGIITITANSTDTYIKGAYVYTDANKFLTLPSGSYYIKSTNSKVRITLYSDGSALDTTNNQPITLSSETNFGGLRIRSTDSSSLQNVSFGIMISTTDTPYEPYGTNQWYLKKNIGKVVLDDPSKWQTTTGTIDFEYNVAMSNREIFSDSYANLMCTIAKNVYSSSATYCRWKSSNSPYFGIKDASGTLTLATLQTLATSGKIEIAYPLATPTYTQITGTLETQLNNIHKNMLSYKGTTNISQVNNDLPFVLGVSAIQDLE